MDVHRALFASGRRIASLAAAGLLAGGGFSGCSQEAPVHLLLITVDTVRADRLGCYGYEDAQTPTVDGLAAKGILFEQAMTTYPLTLPSHASMLTGRIPPGHGSHGNTMPPGTAVPRVARRLADAGYSTGAVVSAFVLDEQFGLDEGFAIYDDDLDPAGEDPPQPPVECRADWTTDRALRWLDQRQGEPFFLWVHYFDAHAPYQPPAPFEGQGYDGEIAYVDTQIARLLEDIEARDLGAAAIVFLADHGEAFGEHDEEEHGLLLYQSTLHVPLIVTLPDGAHAGARIAHPVSVTDVAPTLLQLAGLDAADFQGGTAASLVFHDATGSVVRDLYAETRVPLDNHGAAPLTTLRRGRWKYIDAPRAELYDVDADPGELRNLLETERQESTAMQQALADIQQRSQNSTEGKLLDEETRRRLAALGYVSTPQHRGAISTTDPKDVAKTLRLTRQGDRAKARGEGDVAEAAYRAALLQLPSDWKAAWKLGALLQDGGDLPGAMAVYEATIAADPANMSALFSLGSVQLQQGDAPTAVETLTRVLERVPQHVEARFHRSIARWTAGDQEGAEQDAQRVLATQPQHEGAAELLRQLADGRRP